MDDPGVLRGRLLLWRRQQGETHAENLEHILNRLPPTTTEVVAFGRIRNEFQEVRNILDYYDLHPAVAPEPDDAGGLYDFALGVRDVLVEKERELDQYFQGAIDEYQALVLQPKPTPDGFREARQRFLTAKELMIHYDPQRRQELDRLETRVTEQVTARLLSQNPGSSFRVPPLDDQYRKFETSFLRESAKLNDPAYSTKRGDQRALEELIETLNEQAATADAEGYQELADRINRVLNVAVTRKESATAKSHRKYLARLGTAVAVITFGFIATYNSMKYLAFESMKKENAQLRTVVERSLTKDDLAAMRGELSRLAQLQEKPALELDELKGEISTLRKELKEQRAAVPSPRRRQQIPAAAPHNRPSTPQSPSTSHRPSTPQSPSTSHRPSTPLAVPHSRTFVHDVYQVRPGDTLSGIRMRFYGDSEYHALITANPDVGADPREWVYVGELLIMPPDGLRTGKGLRTFHFSTAQESAYRQHGLFPARLYRAKKDMTFEELSRRLTGNMRYATALRENPLNKVHHGRIGHDDFVFIPASVPATPSLLYKGVR